MHYHNRILILFVQAICHLSHFTFPNSRRQKKQQVIFLPPQKYLIHLLKYGLKKAPQA